MVSAVEQGGLSLAAAIDGRYSMLDTGLAGLASVPRTPQQRG